MTNIPLNLYKIRDRCDQHRLQIAKNADGLTLQYTALYEADQAKSQTFTFPVVTQETNACTISSSQSISPDKIHHVTNMKLWNENWNIWTNHESDITIALPFKVDKSWKITKSSYSIRFHLTVQKVT